tara:strand:+ start:915 stop:1175 length:261 start_codon:yes stop_codon:yes gene_type:complete
MKKLKWDPLLQEWVGINKKTPGTVKDPWIYQHWDTDKSKGLGDTIHKITSKTGIKWLVKFIMKPIGSCGCESRRDKLNKMFPYKNK